MKPKIVCTVCGAEMGREDKFCSSCGSAVDTEEKASVSPHIAAPVPAGEVAGVICPLCGQRNPAGASVCDSCGNALPAAGARRGQTDRRRSDIPRRTSNIGRSPSKSSSLRFFQSWRFTATLAGLLILTVIIFSMNRRETGSRESLPTQTTEAMAAIDSLQHMVDRSPKDAPLLLQLANLLHDQKLYARSVVMYDRYLQLDPSNPDARVDMGISYFELSFVDTLHAPQFVSTAIDEIKRALTYAPRHQLAHYNLGIILLHSGDIDQAKEWLRKCVQIDSTSDVGRRAQQFLAQHAFTKSTTS